MGRMSRVMRYSIAACALAAALLAGCDEVGIKTEARKIVEEANATTPEATWIRETVSAEGSVGGQYSSSIAVHGGEPRIAFSRADTGNVGVWYASRDNSAWSVERVDTANYGIGTLSLDLNGNGIPFIAWEWSASGSRYIIVSEKPSSSWGQAALTTDATGDIPIGNSVTRMSLCARFITNASSPKSGILLGYGLTDSCYYLYSGADTPPAAPQFSVDASFGGKMQVGADTTSRYAYYRSNALYSSGARKIADSQSLAGFDFALDPAYGLHVAFFDLGNIYYSASSVTATGDWPASEKLSAPGAGRSSIAAYEDSAGDYLPCIAYSSGGSPSHLYLTYKTATGTWNTETVDDSANVLYNVDLAVDSLGRIHIAYHDIDAGTLKYARRLAIE